MFGRLNWFSSLLGGLRPCGHSGAFCALAFALFTIGLALPGLASEPLFEDPNPPGLQTSAVADEIILLSTRSVGTTCDPRLLRRGLVCERLVVESTGWQHWEPYDWHNLLQPDASNRRTVIYVHGNRVAEGEDRYQGITVYNSLAAAQTNKRPVRFIIWSWPSEKVPGFLKDYQVKAQRTIPVAWQLAWFIDQLPADTPLSLVGYSYGARVVSGSLHLLAGGKIGRLELADRVHPERSPAKVALVAAAFDADWIRPGRLFGRALSQVEQLLVVTNRKDPAMRFYHFSTDRRRVDPLGKVGVPRLPALGEVQHRVRQIDVSKEVGRSHVLTDYLQGPSKVRMLWQQLLGTSIATELEVHSAYEGLGQNQAGG